jgi:coenzyme F420-0:L-glutamate ligase/coenzyme F420-1:gamma-L-glutamate ligase
MVKLQLCAPENVPDIKKGDNISVVLAKSLQDENIVLDNRDVIVVAQKIVSKAEGRQIPLQSVRVGRKAQQIADSYLLDPRIVQLILSESTEILKIRPRLIIARHKLGYICANAGIDRSNTGSKHGDIAVLLPENPDESASRIREGLREIFGKDVAVIINDSHGRPFREGAIGVALGISGLDPLVRYAGKKDLYGYELKTSVEAVADELSSAATLLMGQSDEGRPVVIIKGFNYTRDESSHMRLIRDPQKDLFG